MSPKPTGGLTRLDGRTDLEIERQFKAPIEDVWQSVTDPESLSRWIGTFSGEPGPGKTVQFRMRFVQYLRVYGVRSLWGSRPADQLHARIDLRGARSGDF